MKLASALKVLEINLKRNFAPHFCLAVCVALLTPIIFEVRSLDERLSAQPVEMMLSLCGTILLTPVFLPEQNEEIRDVIRSKRTGYLPVIILRVVYSLAALALILGGFLLMMHFRESSVTYRHFVGGFTSALFLGALGFATAGISGNAPAGYMVSLIYYIANFSLKNKLGKLFLFSMYAGSFEEKYYILPVSVGLIVLTVCLKTPPSRLLLTQSAKELPVH